MQEFITIGGNWLNNNQGILTFVLFVVTLLFAWVSGFFKWIRSEISKGKKASKIICAWSLFPDKESSDFLEYKFAPKFQNKTDEIIKDFWINLSSSGFELSLNETPQMVLFEGWNMRGDVLQLISKDSSRFAPQNFIEPFEITIKLRKNLPKHDAWLYISYGIPDAKKIELSYKLTYNELKKFVDNNDRSGKEFLKYFGMTNRSFWRVKLHRLFIS